MLHQSAAAKRCGLTQVLDLMDRVLAILFLTAAASSTYAKCIDDPSIRIVGKGQTLDRLSATNGKSRADAKRAGIPFIGLDAASIKNLRSNYRKGDLIYSYEVIGRNGEAFSGGSAVVRGKCIVHLSNEWIS